MKFNRFVIAAPKSGSGKTLITIALMKAFLDEGKKIAGFKCGPDYIDPMFHKNVLGISSKNLDLFFSDENQIRHLFTKGNTAELSIIEGVMGLYDGLGGDTADASTYHLAKTLRSPVILVIDAKGMGLSVVALIKGFLSEDAEYLIKGVILNNMPKSLYEKLAPVIKEKCGIEVLGYFPNQKDVEIESRHLGLKLPSEIDDIREKVSCAAEKIKKTVDLPRLLEIAGSACELDNQKELQSANKNQSSDRPKIAIAMDEAFCFYYEDNLELLKDSGAELVYFSPVHDKHLPDGISGLILGGGYPEFYAQQLEENETIREEIKEKIANGMPSLAECGGFMYLHKTIQAHDKKIYSMAGVIDADCFYTGKLVRFGYSSVMEKNAVFTAGKEIRCHEFHYFDSSSNGLDCVAVKTSGKEYECAHVSDTHFWSFLHCYYPSNPDFARIFVQKCREFRG